MNAKIKRLLCTLLILLTILLLLSYYLKCRYVYDGFDKMVKSKGFLITLMGGLGNQLFIYAAALTFKKKFNVDIFLLNDSSTKKHSKYDYREFMKGTIPIENSDEIVIHATKFGFSNSEDASGFYNDDEIPVDEDTYLLFSPHYFQNFPKIKDVIPDVKDALNSLFSYKYGEPIIERNSTAFIHVRRGDYLSIKVANKDIALSLDYYNKGLDILNTNTAITTIYIFSDDISWCREQAWNTSKSLVFFDDPDELKTLYMMSQCWAGAVISNSTFSLWGVFLGAYERAETIVYPSKAFISSLPDSWIKI